MTFHIQYFYRLKSGNTAYFGKPHAGHMFCGIVVSPDNKVVGGFLGQEAKKKAEDFDRYAIKQEPIIFNKLDLSLLSLEDFAQGLLSLSNIFTQGFNVMLSDQEANESGQACSERHYYYVCAGIYSKDKYDVDDFSEYISIGFLVLNHVSVFGWKNYRETMFRGVGHDDGYMSPDMRMGEYSSYYTKRKYAPQWDFKAPAFYIRSAFRLREENNLSTF